ncbi:hypothetical protein Mtc_1112 [Methanocella conradii HZ254]|uniref:Uncharacterized protein n=1 Tax=Methanocella conradii (strain DSM 24694 / JCM 17849 / CGMCC 1.5162 / HZ254) TaxID=1041930 RepID=H8I7N3_METCZ|nr:hypothetical protein Mtc_1112 [Methanocella conradii HZ254]
MSVFSSHFRSNRLFCRMYDSSGLPVRTNDMISMDTIMMALISAKMSELIVSPVVIYRAIKIPIVAQTASVNNRIAIVVHFHLPSSSLINDGDLSSIIDIIHTPTIYPMMSIVGYLHNYYFRTYRFVTGYCFIHFSMISFFHVFSCQEFISDIFYFLVIKNLF